MSKSMNVYVVQVNVCNVKCMALLPGPCWHDTQLGVCFVFMAEDLGRTVDFELQENECTAWLWPTTAINKL